MLRYLFVHVILCVIYQITGTYASGHVVCYWLNSNGYKIAPPEDLDPKLCTHLNYAFVHVMDNGTLTFSNKKLDIDLEMYHRIVDLKRKNPDLKVLLSLGEVKSSIFSNIAKNQENRKNLVESSIEFLSSYNFDGLDIDWEFPSKNDSENFVALAKELKIAFIDHGWLLTAAISPISRPGFSVELIKYIDIFNVMCYNYFTKQNGVTGQNAPLFPSSLDSQYQREKLNVAATIKNWLEVGYPREKLIIGIPFYGRIFTLVDGTYHGLHAKTTCDCLKCVATYKQILESYGNWTTVWDDEQKSYYKYFEDQWLGYDEERSVRAKIQYINQERLGGAMIWQIGHDDVKGLHGPKQGLLSVINEEMYRICKATGNETHSVVSI